MANTSQLYYEYQQINNFQFDITSYLKHIIIIKSLHEKYEGIVWQKQ